MNLGAARISPGTGGWRIDRQPGPDPAALLAGRPVDEAATLLPRLFNLCRMAQATAARLALGLPPGPDETGPEVIRDHLARLFVTLRRAFGMAPLRPDARNVFGPTDRMPRSLAELAGWLAAETPAAELAREVQRSFAAGAGAVRPLPPPDGRAGARENSPAGRQAAHPLLRAVEADQGRGPFWRYLGMLADLEAARQGSLAAPWRGTDGTAVVQAARGAYALRIDQSAGRVTALVRLTPTDHQLAPGGALEQALSRLPADRADLASRLVALHDPCIPVTLAQVQHA